MMTRLIVIICTALALQLTGCQTYYHASAGFNDDNLDLSKPNLIPGQKAYVWAGGGFIRNLRETGLFASVEEAPSAQPVPNGVYISLLNAGDRWSTGSVMGALLSTFSLGIIPNYDGGYTTQTMELEVYQNGAKLLNTSFDIKLHTMSGLLAPAIANENYAYDMSSKLAVRKMISELNKVTNIRVKKTGY